jgi:hypothetical protein
MGGEDRVDSLDANGRRAGQGDKAVTCPVSPS